MMICHSDPRYTIQRDGQFIERVDGTMFREDGSIYGYDFGGELFSPEGEHLGFMPYERSDNESRDDDYDPQEVQWDDGSFSLEF